MKKIALFCFIILGILITTTVAFLTVQSRARTSAPQQGFAVVELFTSEGCSSCPPAEETVEKLLLKNTANVFILAYHVDYWDRLGWKDPFSKAEFSQRQSKYAALFGLNSVYTPQAIVNGISQFVGSDESQLNRAVNKNLQKNTARPISIDAVKSGNRVTIDYTIAGGDGVLLNFALVQPEAVVEVRRGENSGRSLHHVNIVRALKTVDAREKGSVTMEIPNELSGAAFRLISYAQSGKTFEILGADQKEL